MHLLLDRCPENIHQPASVAFLKNHRGLQSRNRQAQCIMRSPGVREPRTLLTPFKTQVSSVNTKRVICVHINAEMP
jgi:hypothetical protein